MIAYHSLEQGTQEEKELGRGGANEVSIRIFSLEVPVKPSSRYVSLGLKKEFLGQSEISSHQNIYGN